MTHTIPWLLWLLVTMVSLLSTRNPFYLSLMASGLFALGVHLSQKGKKMRWLIQNLRLLLTMLIISTAINALFTHVGKTVLFRFPDKWLLIGGAITLESMVNGAINGLIIGSLYLTFNIINLSLSIKQLTQLIPGAFYSIAMIVTVALTFFPSIQQRAKEIKEAQMIRGNPMKKISDWIPIFVPLLVTSLEKAILLSESMTARGFAPQQKSKSTDNLILGLISAAFALFSGWILHLYHYPKIWSILFFTVSALLFLLTGFKMKQTTKVTRYNQETWQPLDILATITIALLSVILLTIHLISPLMSLGYTPYPLLSPPKIQVWGIILCIFPILPILFSAHD